MAERPEYHPGAHAPVTGYYEELNVFGTRTGRVEDVHEGERLPPGSRGFTWRQIEQDGCCASSLAQVDPGVPEQRVGAAMQLAYHQTDPASVDQPEAAARTL